MVVMTGIYVIGLALVLSSPLSLVVVLYITSFALYIRNLVLNCLPEKVSRKVEDWPILICAHMYLFFGKFWHGYESKGLERIPKEGPALLCAYHAPLPTDAYYLYAEILIKRGRLCRVVGDKFLERVPGFQSLLQTLHVTSMTSTEMCQSLKEGQLVFVSPGGAREALFSGEKYSLLWNNRSGFAKVWLDSPPVPIIPVFTKNGREVYRVMLTKHFRALYEKIRIPCVPVVGPFPVKMTTYIGDPVTIPDSVRLNNNREQAANTVAELSAQALDTLIKQNQRFPASILRGIAERFRE